MSELIAIDTDGVEQFIWLQERDQSCGPACVYMIEREVKRSCPVGGEARIRQIAALLPQGYDEKNGTNYTALALALAQIGIGATAKYLSDFLSYVRLARFPFISHIEWPNGKGHFVVCVRMTTRGAIVCLDPFYGLIESDTAVMPVYQVRPKQKPLQIEPSSFVGVFSGYTVHLTS